MTPATPLPAGSPAARRSPSPARPSLPGVVTALLALLAALVVLAPTASATTDDGAEPAWLRPAHLVPDLGAMDIRLSPFAGEGSDVPADEKPLLETTAAYGAVGQYGALPPGSYAVSVRPAGTPVSEPPVLSLTFELEAGKAYTVAGLGTKAEPRLERLVDDLTPPADGSANVRLLPASLAAPDRRRAGRGRAGPGPGRLARPPHRLHRGPRRHVDRAGQRRQRVRHHRPAARPRQRLHPARPRLGGRQPGRRSPWSTPSASARPPWAARRPASAASPTTAARCRRRPGRSPACSPRG